MNTKYIVTKKYGPIVFPPTLSHRQVAFAICDCIPECLPEEVIGAGMCNIGVAYGEKKYHAEVDVTCYGVSDSLGGIKSRGVQDAELIKRMISQY